MAANNNFHLENPRHDPEGNSESGTGSGGGGVPAYLEFRIPGGLIKENHTDFPLVIYGSDIPGWFWDAAEANGSDVGLRDGLDVDLDAEVKRWDATNKKAWIHCGVDLTTGTDAVVRLYHSITPIAGVNPFAAYSVVLDLRVDTFGDIESYGGSAGTMSEPATATLDFDEGLTAGSVRFTYDSTEVRSAHCTNFMAMMRITGNTQGVDISEAHTSNNTGIGADNTGGSVSYLNMYSNSGGFWMTNRVLLEDITGGAYFGVIGQVNTSGTQFRSMMTGSFYDNQIIATSTENGVSLTVGTTFSDSLEARLSREANYSLNRRRLEMLNMEQRLLVTQ